MTTVLAAAIVMGVFAVVFTAVVIVADDWRRGQ